MLFELSKNFRKYYLDKAVENNLIRDELILPFEAAVMNFGKIMIVKKEKTKENKTMKLISECMPEGNRQMQIGSLSNRKDLCTIVLEFQKRNMEIDFASLSAVHPDSIFINEEFNSTNMFDFINTVIFEKNSKDFGPLRVGGFRYNHSTVVFEVISNNIEEAFNKLQEIYVKEINNENTDLEIIKEKLKLKISCIIEVETENEEEIYIKSIYYNPLKIFEGTIGEWLILNN